LISNIKENIKPEFTEQRYVGRTERFVTYNGVKRTMDLSFNVVAFSGGESDGMWTRINYLTGLAFPTGVANGFMVPPLFKITIGGLYDEQPVYIDTLDYDFLDESTTFDIEREIPFAINVKMRLTILEKRTKYYDSPFYKITEDADKYARINAPFTRTSTFDQSQGFNEAQQTAADARFERELALGRTIRPPEEVALLAGQPERFRAIGKQQSTERAPKPKIERVPPPQVQPLTFRPLPSPPPPPPRPPRRRR
jgi:hypothetical protein